MLNALKNNQSKTHNYWFCVLFETFLTGDLRKLNQMFLNTLDETTGDESSVPMTFTPKEFRVLFAIIQGFRKYPETELYFATLGSPPEPTEAEMKEVQMRFDLAVRQTKQKMGGEKKSIDSIMQQLSQESELEAFRRATHWKPGDDDSENLIDEQLRPIANALFDLHLNLADVWPTPDTKTGHDNSNPN